MNEVSRRRFLSLGGVTVAVGLAGCGLDDEGELVISDTQLHYQEGDRRYEYPQDVGARINVENTIASRQTYTLEVTLEKRTEDGEWEEVGIRAREESTPAGTETLPFFVFESVADENNEISDFRIRAEFVDE